MHSQKLQLLTTREIQTPISYGSFVTEKLGLKMEIPKAQWTEENRASSRQQGTGSQMEYQQLVCIMCFYLYPVFNYPEFIMYLVRCFFFC